MKFDYFATLQYILNIYDELFQVYLGDPHSCTCAAFRKEKDLCKHICWILFKKFRVDKDDPCKSESVFLVLFFPLL